VTPRQKRQGLFKGDLWLDAGNLPARAGIRVSGKESVHLPEKVRVRKKVRDSGRNLGALQVQSEVDTRLAGKAELTIDFSNFSMTAPNGAP